MRKTTLTTTFNRLRAARACADGYRKLATHLGSVDTYGADKPINLLTVLESNGLDDTLWCLRATEQNSDRVARLFAADCAEAVLHLFEGLYPDDKRPRQAIQAARDYAEGRIDAAAWSAAAYTAAAYTATAAAHTAAYTAAAYTAAAAAAAARSETRTKQEALLRRYLAPDSAGRKVKVRTDV